MLLIKDILKETDRVYGERKLGEALHITPIELRPTVQSNQIKALAEVLANRINDELSVLKTRIIELERQMDR